MVVLRVSFGAFFKKCFHFSNLKLLGNKLSLIEELKSCEIGIAKISVPSFRNLPDKLSMSAALGPRSLRRSTKLLFQGSSWSEYIFSGFFFVYLLFLKNVPRLKI